MGMGIDRVDQDISSPEVFGAANFGLTSARFTLQAGWTVSIIGAIERIMRDCLPEGSTRDRAGAKRTWRNQSKTS